MLFERNDDAVTLCEIKCTDKPFELNKEYYENLLNKIKTYKTVTRTKKQIFIGLISASGIKSTKYSEEIIGDVVTLEDLIRK